MAFKVLGQQSPSATTATTLYTVPSSVSAVASSLVICNRNTTGITYRISIRPAGAAQANEHYIAYDVSLPGNTSDVLTIGITLATTDVVTVYCSATGVSFNLFGNEA